MLKFLYVTLVGLLGAALVHLAIVLLLPRLSSQDVWRQIEPITEPYVPFRLDGAAATLPAARTLDPLFAVVACRYDLADGMFSISTTGRVDFWSVAVFDDLGNVLFSGNDRVAATDNLDLAVATPRQMRGIRQDRPPALANAIMAESNRNEGLAVLRVYRPDDSWSAVIDDFISRMRCESVPV